MAKQDCVPLEQSASDYGDYTAYAGNIEAIRATGLIPDGTPMPEDMPKGKRGVRWLDSEGRRCVLSRWRAGLYRLCIYRTAEELASRQRARHLESRRKQIEDELQKLTVSESDYRKEVSQRLELYLRLLGPIMFATNGGGKPWQVESELYRSDVHYSQQHFEEFVKLVKKMRKFVKTAPIVRNVTQISTLRKELVALGDSDYQAFRLRLGIASA